MRAKSGQSIVVVAAAVVAAAVAAVVVVVVVVVVAAAVVVGSSNQRLSRENFCCSWSLTLLVIFGHFFALHCLFSV